MRFWKNALPNGTLLSKMNKTMEFDFREPIDENLPCFAFLHGAGGHKSQWEAQVEYFAHRGYGILVPNLPGHGSSKKIRQVSITQYAILILDLIKELNLKNIILCGHSMGGAIIMEIMTKNWTKRVKNIILIGTGAKLGVSPLIFNLIETDFESALDMMGKVAYGEKADKGLVQKTQQVLRINGPEILYQDFSACQMFDIRDLVTQIECPTLILCGENDQLTPVKFSEYLKEKIQNSELRIIPRAGHFVFQEASEKVNKIIIDFLTK